MKILSINPGSTSTKIALYDDGTQLYVREAEHSFEQLDRFDTIVDQFDYRRAVVLDCLAAQGTGTGDLSAVVGRGGLLPPVKGGGYLVNEAMLRDLRDRARAHASNLGAMLAYSIATPLGIPAYIYDAVSADEFSGVAKITGIPEITRQSFCHVLNSKAAARKVAAGYGGSYADMNFIVAHIGGGISISAHERGRIVDAISDDAGPFSPERAGSVPLGYIIDICYNSGLSQKQLETKLKRNSGLKGHLGTNDCRRIEEMIAGGDAHAAAIYEAQAYQIAKGIGEMAPVMGGRIDAVILTGGMARSAYMVREVGRRVAYLGPLEVVPGENEMESLALGALRILRGEEECHVYTGEQQ